jgi:hypothetical protein
MDWVVKSDGIDDWLSISPITLLVGDYIEFDYYASAGNVGGQYRLAGSQDGFNNALVFRSDSGVRVKANGITTDIAATFPSVDTQTKLKVHRINGSEYRVSVDEASIGIVSNSAALTFDALLGLNTTTSTGTPYFFKGGIYEIRFVSTTASLSRTWSADSSDHNTLGVQPELTDIENGSNAVGVDMPTDGSAWEDLSSGTDQEVIVVTAEQKTESQLVNITSLSNINAVVAEQKTEKPLSAIVTVNNLTMVIAEQLTQSTITSVNDAQLITSVQAQQLTEAITVNVISSGAQDVNVVVTEQMTKASTVSTAELNLIQTVITEQITETINVGIQKSSFINPITAEQITESVIISVNESSGIFVSVVQTEQLTQAIKANINVKQIANTVICEQLSQFNTQQIGVNLTVSAAISEQLTQAELIGIIQQNISTQLNIDIDLISLEILTPIYTIEHIN